MMIMWNNKSYMAMAIVGAGLAVAAAAPASAQYAGYTGYSVYGPHPWNQGAWGGRWFSGPAYGAAWPVPWSAYSPIGPARPAYGYGGY
jgi:hypothetical protein